ncbi:hypothetical protein [Methanoculleus chikugoensis]|uniref:hypothetical protein n=1 Tax=Methanoculleus chikugoensis TaxID=118126 RepID=UPI000B07C844|nr:hypothetical protein [Methanoculleus chikugoensis]
MMKLYHPTIDTILFVIALTIGGILLILFFQGPSLITGLVSSIFAGGAVAGIFAVIGIKVLENFDYTFTLYLFKRHVKHHHSNIWLEILKIEGFLIEAAHQHDYNKVRKLVTDLLYLTGEGEENESYSCYLISHKIETFLINFSKDPYIITFVLSVIYHKYRIYRASNKMLGLKRSGDLFYRACLRTADHPPASQLNEVGSFLLYEINPYLQEMHLPYIDLHDDYFSRIYWQVTAKALYSTDTDLKTLGKKAFRAIGNS